MRICRWDFCHARYGPSLQSAIRRSEQFGATIDRIGHEGSHSRSKDILRTFVLAAAKRSQFRWFDVLQLFDG